MREAPRKKNSRNIRQTKATETSGKHRNNTGESRKKHERNTKGTLRKKLP